jgi:mono/diheme cytochrome c family protein
MLNRTLLFLSLLLTGCADPVSDNTPVPGRWYSKEQVAAGAPLYQAYCAACHAADGSATADWRTPDANGNYPPPPLNGTAHTWHHPLQVLDSTIVSGGAAFGGVMPGFGAMLNEAQRYSIIAWIQSLWPDHIYARWLEIENRSDD